MARPLKKLEQRRGLRFRPVRVPTLPRRNFSQPKPLLRLSKSQRKYSKESLSLPFQRRSPCASLQCHSPAVSQTLELSPWKQKTPSAKILRRGLPKSLFLSQAVDRKFKLSRLNNGNMLSRRNKRNKKRGKNKARRPLGIYTRHRGTATEFLNRFYENIREKKEEEYKTLSPTKRKHRTSQLKDIIPYLINQSPKARPQHDLLSSIASRVKTYWLGSIFVWDYQPKISSSSRPHKTDAASNLKREIFRFPNDPIKRPISSRLSENCVVDLLSNQGKKLSRVLWMRKSKSVKFLGRIPDRVWQIPFAKEVTGMTYDQKRSLLWIFGYRRQIAFHVYADTGYLSIAYSLRHPLGNIVMEYDPENDYLVGNYGSFRVTLRQKDN